MGECFRTQRRFIHAEQKSTLAPAFGAWRQVATSSLLASAPTASRQQQATIPVRRAVSPPVVASNWSAAPQPFAWPVALEDGPTRASSSGARATRFVTAPALSPRRESSHLSQNATIQSPASA